MIGRKRRGLSAEQKAELWKRWKAGQSLHEIGRAIGKDHVVVHFVLARHGGIAPPARYRSRRALTLAEREDNISALRLDGSNGALQLQRNYNGHAHGTGVDSAVGVAVDSMGDPYVTGSSSNPHLNCCVSNIATIKYDGAGNQLWVQRYQGPTPGPDVPVAVVAGRNGNVLVTGASFNPDNGAAAWVTIDYAQTPENLTTGIVSQKRPEGKPETQPNP